MNILDGSFLKAPWRYVIQTLLAFAVLTVTLSFLDALTHAAIVASLGASIFIVFAMPGSNAAEPGRIIGGHVTGLVSGILCFLIFFTSPLGQVIRPAGPLHWVAPGFSVGLSMFLMTILNFEHPPAAGTALALVISPWSSRTVVLIAAFAVILALIGVLLKKYLVDLSD